MNPSLIHLLPLPARGRRGHGEIVDPGEDKRSGQVTGKRSSFPVQPSRRIDRLPRSDANPIR